MRTMIQGLATATAVAAATLAAAPVAAQDRAAHVTVVTSPDAQTQLMAMVLTAQAAEQGHPVRILLCGPGGDLALRDAPESATAPQPPRGMSPQGLLSALQKGGARVEVCAIYLPGRGAGPEVLLDGIGVAQPPEMAATMLGAAGVWSF